MIFTLTSCAFNLVGFDRVFVLGLLSSLSWSCPHLSTLSIDRAPALGILHSGFCLQNTVETRDGCFLVVTSCEGAGEGNVLLQTLKTLTASCNKN